MSKAIYTATTTEGMYYRLPDDCLTNEGRFKDRPHPSIPAGTLFEVIGKFRMADVGEVVELVNNDNSHWPEFQVSDGRTDYLFWRNLMPLCPETGKDKTFNVGDHIVYVGRDGDFVRGKVYVASAALLPEIDRTKWEAYKFPFEPGTKVVCIEDDHPFEEGEVKIVSSQVPQYTPPFLHRRLRHPHGRRQVEGLHDARLRPARRRSSSSQGWNGGDGEKNHRDDIPEGAVFTVAEDEHAASESGRFFSLGSWRPLWARAPVPPDEWRYSPRAGGRSGPLYVKRQCRPYRLPCRCLEDGKMRGNSKSRKAS